MDGRPGRRTLSLIAFTLSLAAGLGIAVWIGLSGYSTSDPATGALGREPISGVGVTMLILFLVWPAGALAASKAGQRAIMWALVILYVAQALFFGFSIGGPHLMSGVPLAILGAILGSGGLREAAPRPTART